METRTAPGHSSALMHAAACAGLSASSMHVWAACLHPAVIPCAAVISVHAVVITETAYHETIPWAPAVPIAMWDVQSNQGATAGSSSTRFFCEGPVPLRKNQNETYTQSTHPSSGLPVAFKRSFGVCLRIRFSAGDTSSAKHEKLYGLFTKAKRRG